MILITGASSGLGSALAKQYDKNGEQLVLSGRSQQKLDALSTQLSQKAKLAAIDLSNSEQVEALFEGMNQTPDTVIHCAGSGYFGSIEDQQTAEIKTLIENNITSSMFLIRELVKRYRDKPVNVVVVMSTAAQIAKAGESTYCAVKWAVKGLVESVRMELKGKPMNLIAVYPGGMATDFWPSSGKAIDTSTFMSADDAATMLIQALTSAQHGYVSDITINRC